MEVRDLVQVFQETNATLALGGSCQTLRFLRRFLDVMGPAETLFTTSRPVGPRCVRRCLHIPEVESMESNAKRGLWEILGGGDLIAAISRRTGLLRVRKPAGRTCAPQRVMRSFMLLPIR